MGNKEQATRKMKQEIRTEEQATGKREKETRNGEQFIGDEEWRTRKGEYSEKSCLYRYFSLFFGER